MPRLWMIKKKLSQTRIRTTKLLVMQREARYELEKTLARQHGRGCRDLLSALWLDIFKNHQDLLTDEDPTVLQDPNLQLYSLILFRQRTSRMKVEGLDRHFMEIERPMILNGPLM